MKNLSCLLALAAAAVVLPGCLNSGDLTGTSGCLAPKVNIPALTGDTVRTASGLKYLVAKTGAGATAASSSSVTVTYAAYLTDGTLFSQSSLAVFQLPDVIPGFREGVTGMKVGETRRLIVPPSLGYGANGSGSCIPGNATLIFDVNLIDTVG